MNNAKLYKFVTDHIGQRILQIPSPKKTQQKET